YADIGWEVLSTMRKAQFGQSLLAGIVIALIAMIMDRISLGAAQKLSLQLRLGSFWQRHVHLWIALGATATLIALAQYISPLRDYPETWIFYPAEAMNEAVEWFTVTFFEVTNAFKKGFMFLLLLPLQIGLVKSVTPYFWGFSMTAPISIGYAALVALLAAAAGYFLRWRVAVTVIIIGALFYYGTTGIPWPAFILLVTMLAFQVGGWRVALLAFLGLWFILLSGAWHRAMLSVYLCGAAVLISFFMGALLGVWGAYNDRVSSFLRPINDTLQTMPMFVFLVPILMVFLIGEFSAFIAIIAYSIVPAIRYTEHGIRNVPHEVVEASTALGCTNSQLLFYVKLPLALPEIMLGLNQTIMFGLAMLVIAALVGTLGLGQMVYHALNYANFGEGAIAGLGIAFIAMITDRILQSWSHKKKIELGLD
ncbi:MAG: ABC transporter permease subunit, partial [Gammaproteobacteria bacterium]